MNSQNKSLFDIMGPVIIGPSSSHTAGVLKLAQLSKIIFQSPLTRASIIFYGSLAHTGKGHGSDRAVIAGLLGMAMDDENIANSFELAHHQKLEFEIKNIYECPDNYHSNTVQFTLANQSRCMTIRGASLGGGYVEVQDIDGYEVSLAGESPTLVVWHHDEIGVIARVSQTLANHGINIAALTSHRREKGEEALLVIKVDTCITDEILETLKDFSAVYRVLYIPGILSGEIS